MYDLMGYSCVSCDTTVWLSSAYKPSTMLNYLLTAEHCYMVWLVLPFDTTFIGLI